MPRFVCMMVLAAMLMGVSASTASALELRLVHAVPGGGSARLSADGASTGPVGFAGVSSSVKVHNGRNTVRLLGAAGNQTLARTNKSLGEGRYTVVATKRGSRVNLLLLRDGGARKGKASLRVVHAAPELGRTELSADGKPVARSLAFEQASPYAALEPGTYRLELMRPSGKGAALAVKPGVNLEAGTSATAVAAGSGGRPVTIVVASDATVTPSRAPKTGLGGLAGGTPWLAALLAALGAGVLGGTAYSVAARRRHGA